MADGPQAELQKLIYETLRGTSAIMNMVGDVYDRVPADPFGSKDQYISFGSSDVLNDGADCIASGAHSFQIDIWSRSVGQVNAKRLVDLVSKALDQQDLQLTENALVEINIDFRRVFPDSDPLITHGVVMVSARIDEVE